MPRAKMIGCALGVAFMAATSGAQAEAKCQLLQIGEFALQMTNNQPIIAATINGQSARLLLDTGAQISTLFGAQARRLKVPLRQVRGAYAYGVGGRADVFTANIDDLGLDKYHAHNVGLAVLDGQTNHDDIDGAIGEDLLSRVDLDVDFQAGVVRLMQPKDCNGDQVVYWNKAYSVTPILASNQDGELVVNVSLNGVATKAMMDTGASVSVVTPRALNNAGIRFEPGGPQAAMHGVGRSVLAAYKTSLPSFAFGDEQIKSAEIEVSDIYAKNKEVALGSRLGESVEPNAAQMLLGADFFMAHRVYIARSQHTVYISYVGGQPFHVQKTPAPPPQAAPGD